MFGTAAREARDSICDMNENEQKHEKKKVTAATTDAPQEEFISPENIPSKTETPSKEPDDAHKSEK